MKKIFLTLGILSIFCFASCQVRHDDFDSFPNATTPTRKTIISGERFVMIEDCSNMYNSINIIEDKFTGYQYMVVKANEGVAIIEIKGNTLTMPKYSK